MARTELTPESMSGLDSLPPATRGNAIQPSGPPPDFDYADPSPGSVGKLATVNPFSFSPPGYSDGIMTSPSDEP